MATSLGMQADAPRGKAGDWEGVIDILIQEHGYILSLLDALEEKTAQLKSGKVPDFLLLRDVIDYLVRFPGEYHHPREDLIYANLRRSDPDFRPLYDRLQREHRALHARNNALFKALTRICEGRPADREALQHMLQDYIKVYRQHIRFETREIFPKARGTLTPAQLKRIESKTRYRDDPLFSNRVRKEYQRLGRLMTLRLSDLEERVLEQQFTVLDRVMETLSDTVNSLKDEPLVAHLPRLPRLRNRPSWQARISNVFTRTMMKPMMRFGTIESMRGMTSRFEDTQARNLPEDVCWRPVQGKDYAGEWLHIHRKRPRKVLLYFPGGGFVMRSAALHRSFVARICRSANCRSLLVHYRLAPETPFPGGLEDCLAAYHGLLDQGIAPEDITIAGDSAGGGLVLSTLLALRDENSPMPANAIVLSPLGDLTYSGKSREFNKRRDPMLPSHRASMMHQLYTGDALPEDRYLSPVLADFDGLPPILGQVGSTEILLDDTVRAAERAKEAKIPFNLEIWRELPHVFPIFAFLPESDIALGRVADFIQTGELDELPRRYGWSKARR